MDKTVTAVKVAVVVVAAAVVGTAAAGNWIMKSCVLY